MSPLPLFTIPPMSSIPTSPRIFLPTPHSTEQLGHLLGKTARRGDILFLLGNLGAGKTAFARGFIRAARNDPSLQVTSPTYLLSNSYPPSEKFDTVPTVTHMDLWRLEDARKRPIVDFEKVFGDVALIEWPDRLGWDPPVRLDVLLEYPNVESSDADVDVDVDDPWGFGDDDGLGAGRNGRFASLTPVGGDWFDRVESLVKRFAHPHQEGTLVLRDA